MTEEDKKAIEILKEITTDDLLNCWEGGEKEYNAIQTILNLIKSQQEEIEVLKSDIESNINIINEYTEELEEQYKITSNIENYIEKETNIRAGDILEIICNTETYIKNKSNTVKNINLRIIKQLNQELEKKDTIIDLMLDKLVRVRSENKQIEFIANYDIEEKKKQLKQYFEKKVEGK